MPFVVLLTNDAARDLQEIHDYIAAHDTPEKAEYVLSKIEEIFSDLSNLPERGVCPKELVALGNREYREISFKPYRIIFRAVGDSVYVMLIVDGRRDMLALLQRRLLAGNL